MNASPDDDRRHRARALFDTQVAALDGATATALRARRREAIATRPTPLRRAWWWPASGLATAVLAAVLWLPRSEGPMPVAAPMAGVDQESTPATTAPESALAPAPVDDDTTDAARFADTALIDLDDDAEFYAWLATVPDDASHPDDTLALPDAMPHEGLTL